MRDDLLNQFAAGEIPQTVLDVLEHAHSVTRGAAVAIRVARVCAVQNELGEPAPLANVDVDNLLALAGSAAALLGDRIELLSQHVCEESQRLSVDKHSLQVRNNRAD